MSWRSRKAPLGLAAVLALVLFAPARLLAQSAGTIRGRVVEAGSGRAVSDARVTVNGTTLGAVTNAAGEYVVSSVPAGAQTVQVRRIGYARRTVQVSVTAGAEARADFQLELAATQLDAIVTTGTAGEAERRTVGNAITQVNAVIVVIT